MYGNPSRKQQEERLARILDAALFPGPISAGIIGAEEKRQFVEFAAEHRRLLQEGGLEPPRKNRSLLASASALVRRFGAGIAASASRSKSNVSTPDPV